MAKTLKDLFLALLNATLILIALCLFLAWRAADTLDDLTATFAQNLQVAKPLTDEVAAMRTEVAGLREELAQLAAQGGDISAEALNRLNSRLSLVNGRMADVQTRVQGLAQAPEQMVDRAVETTGAEFARRVSEIRGCGPAEAEGS
ncbi:hypothetical protein [Primorskyibacter sp. S87]|uniref:hypothetical protein n=1 Tax=Primorskyibacter sp. S87 TaxID=3415126 RepID=UPI003C7A1C3F